MKLAAAALLVSTASAGSCGSITTSVYTSSDCSGTATSASVDMSAMSDTCTAGSKLTCDTKGMTTTTYTA